MHEFSARAASDQAHLRLMETTDLHVHVFPYDYFSDRPVDTVGLARSAALIDRLRDEAANTVLVDNGDVLQGNPMGDFIAFERGLADAEGHPMIRAMNAVRFDAATIGNHDFNYGLEFLLRALAGADFPFVCANAATALGATPAEDSTLVPPFVLLDRTLIDGGGARHPIRIGLIGFLPPQIVTWDRRHLEGRVVTRDIVETARAHVPRMKAAGADLIVALAHSGIGEPTHVAGQENASLPLAAVEGIDVVMTGHQHLAFPGPGFDGLAGVDAEKGELHGKPAVMGGFWGSHVGVIDLMLERQGKGWRIVAQQSTLRPIARRNDDGSVTALVDSAPAVLEAVAREHAQTLDYIRRPAGWTTTPIHSYFALLAEDPSIQIVTDAQRWYVRDLLKGTDHADLPLLSAAAPFKSGGRAGPDYYTDIPAGPLALRHVADLYLYPNALRAVLVDGAGLKAWLERSAGIFNRIAPGRQDQPLVDPDFPSYHFDVIDGVSYEIDVSQPSRFGPKGEMLDAGASRIVNLAWQGRPVTPEMTFVLATNNYRAGGGGFFPGTGGDTTILEAPDGNRDVLLRYIAEHRIVAPAADGNWRLAPLPGTSVLFDTSPKAVRLLERLPGLAAEPVGRTPDGFARLRIRL